MTINLSASYDAPPATSHGRIRSAIEDRRIEIHAPVAATSLDECYAMLYAETSVAGQTIPIRKTFFPATELGWDAFMRNALNDQFQIVNNTPFALVPIVQVDAVTSLEAMSASLTPIGLKFDDTKPKLAYFLGTFQSQLVSINDVLDYGAAKYGRDNWRHVAPQRYVEALVRHTLACAHDFTARDAESSLPHISHVLTNALFLLHFLMRE